IGSVLWRGNWDGEPVQGRGGLSAGVDGTLYAHDFFGLWAFDPDGSDRWSFTGTTTGFEHPPTVLEDGSVVIGTEYGVVAVCGFSKLCHRSSLNSVASWGIWSLRFGLPPTFSCRGGQRRMLRMLDRHAVRALREAGHSTKEIAAQFRVSQRTVQRILKEPPVASASDAEERRRRGVGRPGVPERVRLPDHRARDGRPAGAAARDPSSAARRRGGARREHVLPALPQCGFGAAGFSHGALRGRGRRVRAVRLRRGGRA